MFKEMAEDFPPKMETLKKQIWIQIVSIFGSDDSDCLLLVWFFTYGKLKYFVLKKFVYLWLLVNSVGWFDFRSLI